MKHFLFSLLLFLAPHPNPRPEPPSPTMQRFLGDSASLSIPLTHEGAAFTPGSSWSLMFTAKRQARDTDAQALIQKVSGAGITVTGSTASVELVPIDTATLAPGDIVWDVQAQHLTNGAVATVASGRLTLIRDVSRLTVTSIPVYTSAPPILLGPPGKSAYQVAVDNGFSGTAEQWLASISPSVTTDSIEAALGFRPYPQPELLFSDTDPRGHQEVTVTISAGGNDFSIPGIIQFGWGAHDVAVHFTGVSSDAEATTAAIAASFAANSLIITDWVVGAASGNTFTLNQRIVNTANFISIYDLMGTTVTNGECATVEALDGAPGQVCIFADSDAFMMVCSSPIKWVKLN